MTDPTNRDPAELWVVLTNSGGLVSASDRPYHAQLNLEDDSAHRHVTCYVPKSALELRDKRIEELEELIERLRVPATKWDDVSKGCQYRVWGDWDLLNCGAARRPGVPFCSLHLGVRLEELSHDVDHLRAQIEPLEAERKRLLSASHKAKQKGVAKP